MSTANIGWSSLRVDFLPQNATKLFLCSVPYHFSSAPASHNKPGLWGLGHLLSGFVQPTWCSARSLPSYASQDAINDSTKSHLERNTPSLAGIPPFLSSAGVVFFPLIIWVRAGNPMFGPGPLHPKTLERGSDGFATDTLLNQIGLIADFCR